MTGNDHLENDPFAKDRFAKDRFEGAWLVVEYVFDPDGTYRGEVAQRRVVEPAGADRMLVTQQCEPAPELADHPMAEFAGEWVFEMEVVGDQRRYLGPDVVGTGTIWQPGALTGEGIWPRFGYEFESYSVLVAPDRQLTGGFFSLAGRSVADIVGVAVPEAAGAKTASAKSASAKSLSASPRLDLSAPVPDPTGHWTLQREVGPLLVAADWPGPTQRRRLWAMRDRLGATGFEIIREDSDNGRSASVTVG